MRPVDQHAHGLIIIIILAMRAHSFLVYSQSALLRNHRDGASTANLKFIYFVSLCQGIHKRRNESVRACDIIVLR